MCSLACTVVHLLILVSSTVVQRSVIWNLLFGLVPMLTGLQVSAILVNCPRISLIHAYSKGLCMVDRLVASVYAVPLHLSASCVPIVAVDVIPTVFNSCYFLSKFQFRDGIPYVGCLCQPAMPLAQIRVTIQPTPAGWKL
jgi:hypothetical protein